MVRLPLERIALPGIAQVRRPRANGGEAATPWTMERAPTILISTLGRRRSAGRWESYSGTPSRLHRRDCSCQRRSSPSITGRDCVQLNPS